MHLSTTEIDDLCYTPATELVVRLRDRDLSPVELVEGLLNRIERVNPRINAFATLVGEEAREHARRAEQEKARRAPEDLGPLHGFPVTVKDLTQTAGVRTAFGSKHFADFVPEEDGLIWARLKGAGAILLGKTTTPEFGEHSTTESPLTGTTNNPWDPKMTTGGSSGGAAASVVAGMGPLATGSDGGGSIRVPAALCGAVGLKASRGRIPIYSEASPFDSVVVVGPITRTVADNALMLNVVAGPHPHDPYSLLDSGFDYLADLTGASVDGLRVAFSPDLGQSAVESVVKEKLADAAKVFEDELGAQVEQVRIELPDPIDYFLRWWGPHIELGYQEEIIEKGLDIKLCHPATLDFLERARGTSALELARTEMTTRATIHEEFARIFDEHDLLIFPTTPMVAYPHPGDDFGPLEVAGERSKVPVLENMRCTEAIAHAGYPAITVPCGFTEAGLPVGLQIAAGHGQDAAVLRAAAAFEAAAPWADRRPRL